MRGLLRFTLVRMWVCVTYEVTKVWDQIPKEGTYMRVSNDQEVLGLTHLNVGVTEGSRVWGVDVCHKSKDLTVS